MIFSMTGFGRAESTLENKKIAIEIRSLNSKQLDVSLRIPSVYREKEMEIRKLASSKLFRGKIEISVSIHSKEAEKNISINETAALAYYNDLKNLSAKIDSPIVELNSILKLPNVLISEQESLSDKEWEQTLQLIHEAFGKLIEFRKSEGAALEKDLRNKVSSIKDLLLEIEKIAATRSENIKERLLNKLKEISKQVDFDQNRLEQELVFYLEKFDINEEIVRLKKHCSYFIETIEKEKQQGKKLGFIAQEMGREINTIGSKANEVNIQQLVVQMKDELERIKEQVLNTL